MYDMQSISPNIRFETYYGRQSNSSSSKVHLQIYLVPRKTSKNTDMADDQDQERDLI